MKQDAVTTDRMIQRSEALCREIHDEWMRNSSHMQWEDVLKWKNPVWQEQREAKKRARSAR